MRRERFLVTASIRGVKRSFPWDPLQPLALDPKLNWVLETAGQGVQIRQRVYRHRTSSRDKILSRKNWSAEDTKTIDFVVNESRVEIRPVDLIPPAFKIPQRTQEEKKKHKSHVQQLMVFSGVGNLLNGFQPVKKVYLAYSRDLPVFSLIYSGENTEIRPLADGVKLKRQGERPEAAKGGASWNLKTTDLVNATVIRGGLWWRFVELGVPQALADEPEAVAELEGNQEFEKISRWLIGVVAFVFFISGVIWLIPTSPPQEVVKEEPPVVKIFVPHRKRVVSLPDVPKVEAPQSAPKPIVPEIVRTTEPPALAPKHKGRASELFHLKERAKKPVSSKVGLKTTTGGAASLGALRSAFKDALSLTQKDVPAPSSGPKSKALFNEGGGSRISPTEIKPGYTGSNARTESLSGGMGNASEYIQADRSRGQGGPAFSTVGVGDPEVEEGLTYEEVRRVQLKHNNEVRACYDQARLYQADLGGRLLVAVTISPNGHVQNAKVQESDLDSHSLSECIVSRIRNWVFPKPKGGGSVSAKLPFTFKGLK